MLVVGQKLLHPMNLGRYHFVLQDQVHLPMHCLHALI